MSVDAARKVADAVLLEGYLLYPYRASAAKNRLRWQFGVIVPGGADTGDPTYHQAECLLDPRGPVTVELTVRFLQLRRRTGPVWDEGVVREIPATVTPGGDETHWEFPISVPGGVGEAGESWPLAGRLVVDAEPMDERYGVLRLRIRVENAARWQEREAPRAEVLRRSLVSCHTLAEVRGGEFLSLRDPPEWARPYAAACRNEHTWPVLVDRHVVLCTPIILDDFPQVAPESPMDLHDATEIDELLLLRTMALTDAEKAEARATDPRGAAIVAAADTLPPEIMERLHGAIRTLRPVAQPEPAVAQPQPAAQPETVAPKAEPVAQLETVPAERPENPPWWDPGADASVSPETDRIAVPGGWASRGSKVRLRPGARRTDAQDMFLDGLTATVQAVLYDVDETGYLAVTVDDDPATELHEFFGRYRYFNPDEVELIRESS